jgi:hypothetical protein
MCWAANAVPRQDIGLPVTTLDFVGLVDLNHRDARCGQVSRQRKCPAKRLRHGPAPASGCASPLSVAGAAADLFDAGRAVVLSLWSDGPD